MIVRLKYRDYGSYLHKAAGLIAVELPDGAVEVYHPDEQPTEHFSTWESMVAATQHLLPQRLDVELRP